MNKSILIIVVLIIIIGGGSLVWSPWHPVVPSDESCSDIQDQLLRDDCYWREASQKRDPSICDKIQDLETIDNCYYSYVASSNREVSVCDSIQDQGRKNECCWLLARSKEDPDLCLAVLPSVRNSNEEDRWTMNRGLSLDILNMLNWRIYTNDFFSIKYPDNILIEESDTKVEFRSRERGEHFDGGAGMRRDISRDYMVIAADQEECDMYKEGHGIEECEFGITTPIMYFKIEIISKPIEEVVDETVYSRADISLIDSAKYGLDSKAYYEYAKGFEGTGYGFRFFEYAPESTILVTHFNDMGTYVPLEHEFNFKSQSILFDKMLSTLRFKK